MNPHLIHSLTRNNNFHYAIQDFLLAQRWFSESSLKDAPMECQFKSSSLPAPFLWMEVRLGTHAYRVPIACEACQVTRVASMSIFHDEALNVTISDAFEHARFLEWLLHASFSQLDEKANVSPNKISPKNYQPIRVNQSDQTNTCVFYGQQYFLKFYRKIEPGQNAECSILKSLAEHTVTGSVTFWPRLLAEVSDPCEQGTSTAWGVQQLIPNAFNVWEVLCGRLSALNQTPFEWDRLQQQSEWLDILKIVEKIGPALAKLHSTLALISSVEYRSYSMDWEKFSEEWEAFSGNMNSCLMPSKVASLVHEIGQIVVNLSSLSTETILIHSQTIHGDLHLGQLLVTEEKKIFITDFDGEPIRNPSNNNQGSLHPREEDLAGLARSLDYLVHTAAKGFMQQSTHWAICEALTQHLIQSYEKSSYAPPLSKRFLENAMLRKSLRECVYEWNYRKEMLHVPLLGLRAALSQLAH